MAEAGTDAIASGITTTDHHDPLSFRRDVFAILVIAVEKARGIRREELHSEVNAFEIDSHIADLFHPCVDVLF